MSTKPPKSGKKKPKSKAAQEKLALENNIKLFELRKIRRLYVNNCRLFLREPLKLIDTLLDSALNTLEPINKIFMSSLNVISNDFYALAATFMKYESLKELCIRSIKLDERSLIPIAKFISEHPTLNAVSLIETHITSNLTPYICKFIRSSTSLEILILDNNYLNSGINSILTSIAECENRTKLKRLSIRHCDGRNMDTGLERMISTNRSVKDLDLTGNDVTVFGFQSIVNGLRTNTTLESLNLSSTNISHDTPIYRANPSISASNPPTQKSLDDALSLSSSVSKHMATPVSQLLWKSSRLPSTSQSPNIVVQLQSDSSISAETSKVSAIPQNPNEVLISALMMLESLLTPPFVNMSSTMPILTHLDLRSNNIGDPAANIIASILTTRKQLIAEKKTIAIPTRVSSTLSIPATYSTPTSSSPLSSKTPLTQSSVLSNPAIAVSSSSEQMSVNATVTSIQIPPLTILVTERLRKAVFERIWELNRYMEMKKVGENKKGKGKGSGKKGKGRKK